MRPRRHVPCCHVAAGHGVPPPLLCAAFRAVPLTVTPPAAAPGIRMDLMTVLESLVTDLEAGLDRASSLDELEGLRVDFLGRKGKLAQALSLIHI